MKDEIDVQKRQFDVCLDLFTARLEPVFSLQMPVVALSTLHVTLMFFSFGNEFQ